MWIFTFKTSLWLPISMGTRIVVTWPQQDMIYNFLKWCLIKIIIYVLLHLTQNIAPGTKILCCHLVSLLFVNFFSIFFQLFLFFQYFILLYSLLSDHVTHFVSIFIHIGYLLNLQSSIKYTFVEGLTRNVCLNTIVYSLLRYNYFNIVLIIIAIFNYKKI